MNGRFIIVPQTDDISFEELADILHDAHRSTSEKGLHFVASTQNACETKQRLGKNVFFLVALDTQTNARVGCIAIVPDYNLRYWFNKGRSCYIAMLGVRNAYKGRGIGSLLWNAAEKYSFEMSDILIMDTAVNNNIVIDDRTRNGWKIVRYHSSCKTNYYSVMLAKWRENCPYPNLYINIMRKLSFCLNHIFKRKDGSIRFPFRTLRGFW